MNFKFNSMAAVAAVSLLAAGAASAQLNDGNDGSSSTTVFISVVERDLTNTAIRNLVIDTGATALDLSNNQTPWSTTLAQESEIVAFLNSATGTVNFNVGAALTDQTFGSDLQAIMTTGTTGGPSLVDFSALGTGITKTQSFISNANQGVFDAAGVLAANGPTDFGFHAFSWGDSMGGALSPSNEILFGDASQIQQWRLDFGISGIANSVLGSINSNALTGDISFATATVPVPAAIWLFGSALGMLTWARRRVNA